MGSLSNTLAQEKSLYLKQHATNPVLWQSWSKGVFEKAQALGKPVIVSIGYSSCHWCHVMEKESFQDPYIADLMNKHFLCIKVDREEHPEVDQVYMEAVMMINQHGGWPLNVFCLPDGRPFFGGTYFPSEDKGQGIIPWPQLLMRIADHYKRNASELEENADNILKNMRISNMPANFNGQMDSKQGLLDAAHYILKAYDQQWGGFTKAPKFPPCKILNFLLSIRHTRACDADSAFARNLDTAIHETSMRMACGGLYDHLGGGFFRYCVDQEWAIPHFEKMLYDNGQLIEVLAKAYQRYKQPVLKSVIEETVAWLEREMKTAEGLYTASLDADSEAGEGAYYVWTENQLKSVLSESEFSLFYKAYVLGEVEEGVGHLQLKYSETDLRDGLIGIREKLLSLRQQRSAPTRDNKQIVAWNSLLATGLIHAGFATEKLEWIELARKLVDNLWRLAFDESRNCLHALIYEELPTGDACLSDYAYLLEAILELHAKCLLIDSRYEDAYLKKSLKLVSILMERFKDSHEVGYHFTEKEVADIIPKKKEWFDNAMPASNAVLLKCFSVLYMLTGDEVFNFEFNELAKMYSNLVTESPGGIAMAACALVEHYTGLVCLRVKSVDDLGEIYRQLKDKPYRWTAFALETSLREPYQLCIGTQCFVDNALNEVLEKIV